MFETIVLAVDGSEGSDRAASLGADLARSEGARLVIVHVDEHVIGKGGGELRAGGEELRAQVRRQAEELSSTGLEASVEFRDSQLGGPAHAIADAAGEAGGDLIVVGTRGQSSLSGLMLGSVTQRLLHIAPCPVLSVPPA